MTQRWRWIPNALTFLRILLIIPFSAAILVENYSLALVLFFVAAATDGIDGFLARHFNWHTRLGAIADPLADKALLLTSYLMLSLNGDLPVWLFLLVAGRDLLIVCGGLAFHYAIGRFDMEPSVPGKINTFIQILVVLGVIIVLAGVPLPDGTITAGIFLVTISAVYSGAHYVIVWTTRAWRAKKQ